MKKILALCVAFVLGPAADISADVPRKEDIPKLIKDLKSANAKTRANACEALGHRGSIKSSDIPTDALETMATMAKKDPQASVRIAASEALGKIAREADMVVPALVEVLKDDKDFKVRTAAARALGAMGGDAKDAIPALREVAQMKADRQERDKQALKRAAGEAMRTITGSKKKKN